MADKKISQLATVSTPLAGTEVLPIVQSGTTKKVTALELTGTTVDPSGNITIPNGNLVQGTAAKGINFTANTPSAGMTSQLLNWYEEGTWTAVLSDGTNNATMSAVTQSYTRIGRMVTLTGYIQTSSLGSVTGNLRITGLPFAAGFHSSGSVGLGLNLNITANQAMGLFIDGGANYLVPTLWDAATGTSTMQASEWSSDGFIAFSFSYAI